MTLKLVDDDLGVTQRETRVTELSSAVLSFEEQTRHRREYARQWIALISVGSLAFIVIGAFVSLWIKGSDVSIDDIIKVIEAITSPVVGIVGAVTGFYFGESRRDKNGSS